MKKLFINVVLLCFFSGIAHAQPALESVSIGYFKNGIWHLDVFQPGSSNTVQVDHGSIINVVLKRTQTSSTPVEYWLTDVHNNNFYTFETSNAQHLFHNCVGPLNTQLLAGITQGGNPVEIFVKWLNPPIADLIVSNLRVNESINPNQTFHVGQTISVKGAVWNIGGASAGSSRLGYYIKSSANNASGSPFSWTQVPGLAAGSVSYQNTTYTFTSQDVGTRYFVFEADYLNQVDEDNTNNNVRSFGPFQVVGQPSLALSPTTAGFGAVEVGVCSDHQTFTLANDGTTNISGHISIYNPEHFEFESGGDSYSLSPGQSRTIKVKFCPQSAGSKTTTLRIFMDGLSNVYAQANLSGQGLLPPEVIIGISDEFVFDTRQYYSGGIFLKIIETAGTDMVKKVGYEYSFRRDPSSVISGTVAGPIVKSNYREVSDGFVFLSPPDFPEDNNIFDHIDFLDQILLFDENDNQIGHINFSYSFEWEGMHSRHAVLFFHNDDDITGAGQNNPHFPYHADSPNNYKGKIYNYYHSKRRTRKPSRRIPVST